MTAEGLEVALRALSAGFFDDVLREPYPGRGKAFNIGESGSSEDRRAAAGVLERLAEIVPEHGLTAEDLSPRAVGFLEFVYRASGPEAATFLGKCFDRINNERLGL